MSLSDDYGIDDDETEFLAAATQVEVSQPAGFAASPRPTKRRRLRRGPGQLDGASSDDLEWSGSDEEHSPPKIASRHFQQTAVPSLASKHDVEDEQDPEEDPSYYFSGEQGGQDQEDQPQKQSKYKIHIPKNGGLIPDLYLTQTQAGLDDDDGHVIRGAVWKKPKPPPPPLFNGGSAAGSRPLGNKNVVRPPLRGLDAFVQRTVIANHEPVLEDDEAFARQIQAEEVLQHRSASKPSKTMSFATMQTMDFTQELADLPSDAFSSSSPEKSPAREVITISSQTAGPQMSNGNLRAPQTGLKQMTIFGKPATQSMTASQAANKKHAWPLKAREEPKTHHELIPKEMETWVYPTNLGTIRDYQYNIVSRSLFHNTLVALPTGLGKTFIAATVMLNWYRWTKDAQIVFMAPTKPLIAQQMEACYGIAGIPRRDTVLMTGDTKPAFRAEDWLEKRVFFMTPQTVMSDLKRGTCDPKRIVMVVVDEAHKATGGYAYTEVVSFLRRFNPSFRVLALTATPGAKLEAVQAVIDSLGIARVELRTEDSLDIRQYTHEKQTETEVFEYSEEQELIMDHISKAIKPVLDKLNSQNAYWSRDPMVLTAYGMNMSRQKWMSSDAGRKAPQGVKGMVNAIFAVLASLGHSISLLKYHGIAPFFVGALAFQRSVESGENNGKYAKQITQSEDWMKAMDYMRTWSNSPDFIGHPKLQYLREVVMNHFLDAGEGNEGANAPTRSTRIMVFTSFRDSTQDICRVLKRSEPMIRPSEFVGQANSKGSEGMNQKKQNQVIQDFKAGKFNVLVATSIGEEGLDIGDVDLIINFDASSSPIRMLQRIGRTGRKRIGRVVLLLMKGKEESDYEKAKDSYAWIQKSIADDTKYSYRDDQSLRILPKEAQPVVDKRAVDIPPENSQPIDLDEKATRRRGKGKVKKMPPKKFHMPDNVRTGFVSARKLGSDEDEDEEPAGKRKAAKRKTPAKAKKRPPSPEPEPAQLPFLNDVLLSVDQQSELERKYAQASDASGNLVVRAPEASMFPDTLRVLGDTKYVGHGRALKAVSKAMQAVRDIDETRVQNMKDIFDAADLKDNTGTRARLVSPDLDPPSEAELPTLPVTRAAPKAKAKPAAKKPAPRSRKNQPLEHATSYGSAAMEGGDSSPEPTPADMRIGTQGIDLGSRDTSGEDDDEEPDTELEDFVVGSDLPIETVSSSLPVSQPRKAKVKLKAKRKEVVAVDSSGESEGVDTPRPARIAGGEGDVAGSSPPPAAAAARLKKRRVVEESDDE